MDAPAAGQYRRINVPQKGRPPSPPPAQLPGCVAGRFSNPGGAGALEWHLANGAPVRRRLRSSSPKAREGLKGSVVLGVTPRPYHNEERAVRRLHQEKTAFTFDAAPALGGVRARSLRRAPERRNLAPSWSMGENFPPAATEAWLSPRSRRRSLSPRALMAEILSGEAPSDARRLRGRPAPFRMAGVLQRPVETAAKPTLLASDAASPERRKEDFAAAMAAARPIMWFGEAPPEEERWSPFSWSHKPLSKVWWGEAVFEAGEFSPRRAPFRPAGDERGNVLSPRSLDLEGRSVRKGLCSPRDERRAPWMGGEPLEMRGKRKVKTAPETGGMSAALQWPNLPALPPVAEVLRRLDGPVVRDGQGEVERIQAKIAWTPSCAGPETDDMWLQEMMLGCDTELFETVRKDAGPGARRRKQKPGSAEEQVRAQVCSWKRRPSQVTQVLVQLRHAKRPRAARFLLQAMASARLPPNPLHRAAAVSVYAAAAAWAFAVEELGQISNLGSTYSTVAYNSSITALEKSYHWQLSLHLHQEMARRQVRKDVISFSAGISALEKAGQWQRALTLFRQLGQERLKKDRILQLGWSERRSLAHVARNRWINVFKNPAYAASISACEKGSAWQHGLALYQLSLDEGVHSDEVIYGAAISACEKGAHWKGALALFDRFAVATAPCCSAVISACEKAARWQLALQLLSVKLASLRDEGEVALSAAISACGKALAWESALSLLRGARGAIAFNAAMAGCGDAGEWSWTLWLFEEMLRQQLTRTEISFNACVNAMSLSLRWEQALQIYESMRPSLLRPDILTLNALVQGFLPLMKWTAAVALLDELPRMSVQGNVVTEANILKLCRSSGERRATEMAAALPMCSGVLALQCFQRAGPRRESGHGAPSPAVLELWPSVPRTWLEERAAEAVEAGECEPSVALGRGLAAAEETEALALQSLHARLQARDCVRFDGGAQALEQRVRQAMEVLLKETREEYNSTLSMKTAKAEVVQELQDRGSQHEWTVKQLQDAVELLEDSQLCEASAPRDLELFFADALSQSIPEELQLRAGQSLEALVRCGQAAQRVLQTMDRRCPGESEPCSTPSVERSPEVSAHDAPLQVADVTLKLVPSEGDAVDRASQSDERYESASPLKKKATPGEPAGASFLAPPEPDSDVSGLPKAKRETMGIEDLWFGGSFSMDLLRM
ncbi:unnamed protein product [Durusdinium trenchii]|uniref:Pentatricopeptide repeat-containing protein, chloroplastic n=1 Tax=Durusdinium trenchii TaxID=1381693 RepID=A0ABP0JYK6_9DINO